VRAREGVEILGFGALIALMTTLAFSASPALGEHGTIFAYLPIVFVLGTAIRGGPKGVTVVTFLLAVIAVCGTASGVGPFIRATPHESLATLHGFLMAASLIGLITAAAISERDLASERARATALDLQFKTTLLEAQSETTIDGILAVDNEGKAILFNKRFGELWNIPPHLLEEREDERLQHVIAQIKDPDAFIEKVAYLYEHKDAASSDEIEFKDGSTLERYSSPLRGKDGTYHGRIWFFHDITQRKRMETEKERLIGDLQDAASSIRTLHGLLPICAACKSIRDDGGYWHQIEEYITDHSDADFTHGLCPPCLEDYKRQLTELDL